MRLKKILIPALLFFSFFGIYVHNLARGIYAGDVGDFVTASVVGGVPHAPGYPLFAVLGFLLSRFSFWPSPAFAVGLVSALSGCIALLLLYLLSMEITRDKFASILASATLGFSFLFWFYSEVAEVFVLNALFVVLLFLLALYLRKKPSIKRLFVLSFFVGLSLTNHQTIIFIFPSLLLLTFSAIRKLLSLKSFILSIVFLLLGFSFYLYPFFATLTHPIINWDPVTNIPSFLHLLLRQDYGTFNAGPFGAPTLLQRFVILKTYGMYTLVQLTIPVMFLSIVGLIVLWKKDALLAFAFLLAFFLIGPAFIFYAGFPPIGNYFDGVLERFLLASQVIIFFFFPVGLVAVIDVLSKVSAKQSVAVLFRTVFLIIPTMLFFYNFPKTDLSHFYLTEQYAKDILLPLPKNTLLFTTGDTATFNVWYVRYALKKRKDVDLVNMGGLGVDKIYQEYVRAYLAKHPHAKSSELTANLMLFIHSERPVFSLQPVEPDKKIPLTWIPVGLSYELLGNNAPLPEKSKFIAKAQKAWSVLHVPQALELHKDAYGNVSAADIPANYVTSMLATGDFLLTKYKDPKAGKIWFDKALAVDPTLDNVHAELGIYYITDGKQCLAAAEEFKKAIALNKLQIATYVLLYETYLGCLRDNVSAQKVATDFRAVFQEDFSVALKTFFSTKK